MQLATPVLFLIFNRRDTAVKVFECIREVKPDHLYIAADGPRLLHPEDLAKCQAVREAILGMIDWKCEVKTFFRDHNLGCGIAPAEGISWFFDHVEEGIILEDDCLPSRSFFMFAENLLKIYRDDPRVMHITGNNFQDGQRRGNESYYFSAYSHVWGWASWRRKWKAFDYHLKDFSEDSLQRYLLSYGFTRNEISFWITHFKKFISAPKTTWDYQWMYAIWSLSGLSVIPNANLVTNIGFNAEATHTKTMSDNFSRMRNNEITSVIPAEHIVPNREADLYTFENYYASTPEKPMNRLRSVLKRMFH